MPIYQDLNLSLRKHPGTNDLLKKTDVEAVRTSIRNVVMGDPFDSPFDPHFGGAIRGLLFQLASPAQSAITKRQIMLKLDEYEPRCTIENIEIKDSYNGLDVQISFYVSGMKTKNNISFILERTR